FLLAAAARTCREGPRTPNSRPSSARQADSETQLGSPCTASPRPLLLASPSEDSQPRDFVVSSVKACVDRRVLSSQLLPLAYARSGSNLSTKPKFFAALSAGGCCMDVQRGAPNSELSTKLCKAGGQRNATWLSCTASPRPLLLESPSEDSQPRVRCVERKGLFLLAAAAWTCREGPRTPNSRPSSARQADSETQLGSPCTASPRPLLLASPSEDSQPRVRCVERKGVCGQKGALVSASATRLRSLRKQPLYETSFLAACLLADAARTCREGPELRTLDQALRARRTAGRNLALLLLRLLLTSPSEIDLGGKLALIANREASSEVSRSTVRCVERKGVCGQKGALVSASAPRLRSLRKQPLYESLAACSAGAAAWTCREGPRTPNSRPSSARQADSETQLGSPCTASPRPLLLASPSEDSQPRVRCVEPCLLADAARTCREGPRTPNSRPSSARQADSETQLGSPCTASPRPLLLASPSEDSQPRVRCVERKGVCGQKGALVSASATRLRSLRKQPLYETSLLAAFLADAARTCRRGPELRTLDQALQAGGQRDATWLPCTVLRDSQREFVVSSVKACVDRRVLSSQLLPLAYARSGSNLSTKPPFWQLCLLADAARTCREGPELRTLDQALRARRTAGRNLALLLLRLLLTSSSEIDLGGNLALIANRGASSEVSRSTVRCVERKGVCGQKGALVSASAPRLRSLRKQPLYETSFLAACLLAAAARTCKRGPRTPNSRPSSARQADNGTQLWCSSTASPRPLLLTSPRK
ncbi:hypothetical protein Avbf_00059, partial [Armadillidium vulgare]